MRLAIRPEQMLVINEVAEENFVRRIAAHLAAEYPRAVVTLPDASKAPVEDLPEEELFSLIRTGIRRARGRGFDLESTIAAFVAVMFEVCPNFDNHRLCEVMLADEEIEPNARLDELLNVLTEKNWEAIRETYDPQAWHPAPEISGESDPVENAAAGTDARGTNQTDFLETVMN
ncbi:MAG TPA: hypothetical protein VIL74_08690 [Pyrinomonadaceae bacterium]